METPPRRDGFSASGRSACASPLSSTATFMRPLGSQNWQLRWREWLQSDIESLLDDVSA